MEHELTELDMRATILVDPVDPQPGYARFLEECPIREIGGGAVELYRMADILVVNRHPDIRGAGGVSHPGGTLGAERPLIPLDLDGPEHTKYRKLLDPLFAPRKVALLEPMIIQRTDELIDAFIDRGRAEFFGEFCGPLPSNIFMNLVGVPVSDMPRFLSFKDDVIRPQGSTIEEIFEFARAAGRLTYAYFNEVLDEREQHDHPGDDLIGWFMTSEVDGHRLTRENILDILYLLMIAGLDTVASSFSCIIAWLAQHPEERRELTADPSRWALALEELMRFESPVFVGTRLATKDVEINGRAFTAGTTFIVSWAAANLDPAAFEDAQTVKLDRSPNKHIAFASGMHRCLGSHLARLELRTALQRLHERIPDYRIDPDDEMVYETVGVRGAKRLPIVWD